MFIFGEGGIEIFRGRFLGREYSFRKFVLILLVGVKEFSWFVLFERCRKRYKRSG